MNTFKLIGLTSFFVGMAMLNACSNDDEILSSESDSMTVTSVTDKSALDFVAMLTPEQQANIDKCGEAFLPKQQKNSWNAVVDGDIPTNWGWFDSPIKKIKEEGSRAVGIGGAYPAQYWSMIRLKNDKLPDRILDAMVATVEIMESQTNIRFYNSTHDDKSFTVGGITIEYPNLKVNMLKNSTDVEGTGSFGLVGGEQYIYVPNELTDRTKYSDEEVIAFFLHAFCNAAGMFNEQQRADRDNYVQILDANIKESCKVCFNKQTSNYQMLGAFDYSSVTLASSKSYSKNGQNTILKKGGGEIAKNLNLSTLDKNFLNGCYLPYIARTDNYVELDTPVYTSNGTQLSEAERIQLQNQLNAQRGLYGTPPANGRIEREAWQ
ncbi:MAG TPA: peptidase M12 [Candidatus Phocaeicola merdavium]|nr:peptidase M12 [Candidatus Phocaeicola merdavium]